MLYQPLILTVLSSDFLNNFDTDKVHPVIEEYMVKGDKISNVCICYLSFRAVVCDFLINVLWLLL